MCNKCMRKGRGQVEWFDEMCQRNDNGTSHETMEPLLSTILEDFELTSQFSIILSLDTDDQMDLMYNVTFFSVCAFTRSSQNNEHMND